MNRNLDNFNLDEAVYYHYNKFPPKNIDYQRLMKPLASASSALARYDKMLQKMHNNSLLVAPLQKKEAVLSSQIEGAIST